MMLRNWRSLGGAPVDRSNKDEIHGTRRQVSEEHRANREELQKITENIKKVNKAMEKFLADSAAQSAAASDTGMPRFRGFSLPTKLGSGHYPGDENLGRSSVPSDYEKIYYEDMMRISNLIIQFEVTLLAVYPCQSGKVKEFDKIDPDVFFFPRNERQVSPHSAPASMLSVQSKVLSMSSNTPTNESLKGQGVKAIPKSHTSGSSSKPSVDDSDYIGTTTPKIQSFPVKERKCKARNKRNETQSTCSEKSMTNSIQQRNNTISLRLRDMETLSLQKENTRVIRRGVPDHTTTDKPLKLLDAPNRKENAEIQYLARKIKLDSIIRTGDVNKNEDVINKAWQQVVLQTVGDNESGRSNSVIETQLSQRFGCLVNNINSLRLRSEMICAARLQEAADKIRAFHKLLESCGNVQAPHVVYYGDRDKEKYILLHKKVKAVMNEGFTQIEIERLRKCLIDNGVQVPGTPVTSVVKQRKVLMTGLTDGTRVIYYKNQEPAIIQSRSSDSLRYYFVILGNVKAIDMGYFRGIITPSGGCTFYYPDGNLWYIHSGKVGLSFDEKGRTTRQWDAAVDHPPIIKLQINDSIRVVVRSGYQYEVIFEAGAEKVILTAEGGRGASRFTFETQSDLRDKYGHLYMPNGYTSMASRDHRGYLKTTKKHDIIDQTIPEGYHVMRYQANEALYPDVINRSPIASPRHSSYTHHCYKAGSRIDVFIKQRPPCGEEVCDAVSTHTMDFLLNERKTSKRNSSMYESSIHAKMRGSSLSARSSHKNDSKGGRNSNQSPNPNQTREVKYKQEHKQRMSSRQMRDRKSFRLSGNQAMLSNSPSARGVKAGRSPSHGGAARIRSTPRHIPHRGSSGSSTRGSRSKQGKQRPTTNSTDSGHSKYIRRLEKKRKRDEKMMKDLKKLGYKKKLLDARNWYDDDPLIKHYNRQLKQITERVNKALSGWSETLMQFLGMSENYSISLTKRLFDGAKKDYRLSTDYLLGDAHKCNLKKLRELKAKPQ